MCQKFNSKSATKQTSLLRSFLILLARNLALALSFPTFTTFGIKARKIANHQCFTFVTWAKRRGAVAQTSPHSLTESAAIGASESNRGAAMRQTVAIHFLNQLATPDCFTTWLNIPATSSEPCKESAKTSGTITRALNPSDWATKLLTATTFSFQPRMTFVQ